MDSLILVVNAGSSSVKLAAYRGVQIELRARLERTESSAGTPAFQIQDGDGNRLPVSGPVTDRAAALQAFLHSLRQRLPDGKILAVGHRVVHGGGQFRAPVVVTPEVLSQLDSYAHLAPLHQPHNLAEIRTAIRLLPETPQVACFDTAFHATMPRQERLLGLPRRYFDEGVQRYGFHGLSFESILAQLKKLDARAATGRLVACHLGNGASLCAIRNGESIATTMSFTPLDGLLMGTRAGALDPGVVLYLMRHEGLSADQMERLLDRQSGLLGVSGVSSDMRDLLVSDLPEARDAVDLFCYRLVREFGAMTAALEGLETVVFTGGIGENSPEIRERVCSRLHWHGLELDPVANQAGALRLDATGSRVAVYRIPTDEEAVIAGAALRTAIA